MLNLKKVVKILPLMGILFSLAINAQSFETTNIPPEVQAKDSHSSLSISSKYYKDGQKSLYWKWNAPQSVISFSDKEIEEANQIFGGRGGVKFWIFNEKPNNSHLTFNFNNTDGVTQYTFDFNLNFTGWRAGWIAYSDMWTTDGGQTSKQDIATMEIVAPKDIPQGDLWIDRIEFDRVDRQATPDAQIPENNHHLAREIWHWGLLHKWEQYEYDIPVPSSISSEDKKYLQEVIARVKDYYSQKPLSVDEKNKIKELEKVLNISEDATKGAPLMQKDNLRKGDATYIQVNNLLELTARGWINEHKEYYKNIFVKTVRYMLNQGFAYESAMGTNHHYGYTIREMYGAVWNMKDVLKQAHLWEETRKALVYWSGLQETRLPHDNLRDEMADSWNTLLMCRLTSALMADTPEEQYRNMKALSRWVSGSLDFKPGTIGGLKPDGTGFHHGGHYPAYAVPGFASIGQYLKCTNGTPFGLDKKALENYKFALMSVARQTNLRNWGLGTSGRHPFHGHYGGLSKGAVLAYAYGALAFGTPDRDLAGQYLRMIDGMNLYSEGINLKKTFEEEYGISKAESPQGFYVYNYASLGVYRYKDIMVYLKGFNRNVWGAELYARDNRYGRYQSYGSIQIIGTKDDKQGIITEEASRFKEAGWDWNRNPGTTAIYLPLDKLESPFKGSDMLDQPNDFAGASALENGKYGMFAMKLGEGNFQNFTPSFNAYKSAFCFDGKIVCLGTNISNDNSENPTTTTLFQQYLKEKGETISINDKKIKDFPYKEETNQQTLLQDITGYYYYIPKGQDVIIEKKAQQSRDNKKKQPTNGDFAFAYLNQGKSPSNASYEYMILLDASKDDLKQLKKGKTGYQIIRKDNIAHVVEDTSEKVRGYAVFENYTSSNDDYILKSDDETILMLRPKGKKLYMSVCSPDLHIDDYSYTTSKASQPIVKKVLLKGNYQLSEEDPNVTLKNESGNTEISVTCVDGILVDFILTKK